MTRACGLIGKPLGHSISSVFQQAAFDALRLDVTYFVWETSPEDLPARMRSLQDPSTLGCNVTIPHKRAVLPYLAHQDRLVQRVGAANTLVNVHGALHGYNTDVGGFWQALHSQGGMDPQGVGALVLGAGGAARAVCVALLDHGVDRLWLSTRRLTAAEQLAESLADVRVVVIEREQAAFHNALRSAALVVNATPLGMLGEHVNETPLHAPELHPGQLVFDLVANPLETRLMREAHAAGARAIGGLPMLVYQGAEAFERWTQRAAPIEVMLAAAKAHMERMGQSHQDEAANAGPANR